MRYIKTLKESIEHNEIKELCDKYKITDYIINEDLTIDVNGDVLLSGKNFKKLPLKFNKVSGDFYCAHNSLTSLEGAPKIILKDFSCVSNELTSLKYCPKYVGGNFSCTDNFITSLDSHPEYVGKIFYCSNNPIGHIYRNIIKSLDNIELFNEFKIIIGNNLYLSRLDDYIKTNNILNINKDGIQYYKIIK